MTFSQRLALSIAATLALVGVCTAIITTAPAQPTLSLPFATVTGVAQTSVQIIGANPSRRSIQICLPAVAAVVMIAPAPITPVSLTTGIAMTSTATITGPLCFTPPPLTASGSTGGAGAAWNAIASTGTVNVLVLEW